MRLTALTGAAALAAAFVLAPGLATATAAAAPAPALAPAAPSASDTAMRQALQRDLHLTADQARIRLAHEAAAPVVEQRLRTQLAGRFGGAWFTPASGRLTVGVTTAADAAAVRAAGAEPAVVRHSQRELNATKDTLDRVAGKASTAVYGWYVDVVTNSVVVSARDRAAAATVIAAGGLSGHGDIRIETSAQAPRTLYDVRGGDQYVINGNTLCSIGFSVAGGFVTAGHCGGAGSPTLGYNNVSQGTFQGSSFPGNDYAWVRTNGSWTSQPWVNNYAGGSVTVAGSQEAAVGSSICRSGRTTGWRCGTVQAKNVTVNYSGSLVYGLTQTNACAEGGDSGGSWITGNQAQGVTSGGSGNCSTGGTTFFQPVNEILGAYGLSLTTTGGGGTSRIIGWQGKCIDVPNSNTADGTRLQLWDCNGTNAQNWTFAGDGTVRAFGKCMDVAWGSSANGTAIQLVGCNGNPAQQFVLSGAGDLVNPQANKCVDVTGWGGTGTPLELWDCTGGANQKWYRG